jgi:hypothetical protein
VLAEVAPNLALKLATERRARQLSAGDDEQLPPTRSEQLSDLLHWVQRNSTQGRIGAKFLKAAGTNHQDFAKGAKHAYMHVAGLWSSDHTLTEKTTDRLATPFMSELLSQVHLLTRDYHHLQPNVIIQPQFSAAVLKMEIEEGRAHKPGQYWGMWDGDEIWAQLMDGVAGTEAQWMKVLLEARNVSTARHQNSSSAIEWRPLPAPSFIH